MAAGRGLMILGGLVKGVGEGVVDTGKYLRDMALKKLEEDSADSRVNKEISARHADVATEQTGANTRNDADNATRVNTETMQQTGANTRNAATITGENTRDEADRKSRGLQNIKYDKDGNALQFDTTTNTWKPALDSAGNRITSAPKASASNKAAALRAYNQAVKESTTTDPDKFNDPGTVNWEAVANKMDRFGDAAYTDYADIARMNGGGDPAARSGGMGNPAPDGTPTPTNDAAANVKPKDASSEIPSERKAEADTIKADYKAGKISKEEANRRLNALVDEGK